MFNLNPSRTTYREIIQRIVRANKWKIQCFKAILFQCDVESRTNRPVFMAHSMQTRLQTKRPRTKEKGEKKVQKHAESRRHLSFSSIPPNNKCEMGAASWPTSSSFLSNLRRVATDQLQSANPSHRESGAEMKGKAYKTSRDHKSLAPSAADVHTPQYPLLPVHLFPVKRA